MEYAYFLGSQAMSICKNINRLSDKELALLAAKLLQPTTETHVKAFITIVRSLCREEQH